MRLKSIKLAGFKSFVDPTTVTFKSNMTGIVGPNGCGKSNVIDAVRWVMGESSAKYLRGESMTDVIFNGSRNRKPVSQASIELIFDNASGKLGGAYAQYAEISVKRVVTRDGQSGYLINGSKCRRRDITDLFLGTGLGSRSYAIIEQGMISRLIEARPEELRVYLEEAAGISRYKERRKETENRIRRTRDNLDRLNDVRDELGKQLERLGRQAEAARHFQQLKARERTLKAELAVLRWREADHRLADILQQITEDELKQEACLVRVRQGEAQLEASREHQAQASDQLEQAQKQLNETGLLIARLEQGQEHRLQQERQLKAALAEQQQQQQQALAEQQRDEEQLAIWRTQLEENRPLLEELAEQEAIAQENLQQLENQLHALQEDWDAFHAASEQDQRQAALSQARIQQLQQQLQQLAQREQRLQQQREEYGEADATTRQLDELLQEQTLLQEQLLELQQQEEALLAAKLQLQEQLDQLDGQRQEQLLLLHQQQGRLASLQALQQEELQGADPSLEQWLNQQGWADCPRLGSQLDVQPGWEKAVEVCLQAALQGLLLPDLNQAAQASLPSGDLLLLQAAGDSLSAPVDSLLGKLNRPEQLPFSLQQQLQQICVVDDLASGLARRAELQPAQSLVTPLGEQIFADAIRLQSANARETGILLRQQVIGQLEQQCTELTASVQALQQQQQAQKDSLQQLETHQQQLQLQSRNLQQSQQRQAAELASLQAHLSHNQQRSLQLREELQELAAQREQLIEDLAEQQEIWQEVQLKLEANAELREARQMQRQQSREQLETRRQQHREAQQRLQEARLRQQQLLTSEQAASQALKRLETQLQKYADKQEQIQQALLELHEPGDEQVAQLDECLNRYQQQEEAVSLLRQQQQLALQQQRELEQARQQLDRELDQLRQRLEQQRIQQQSLMVRRDAHLEVLQELQLSFREVLDSLPAEAIESRWQSELETIQERIRRLGAINLAAIEEYDQQAERKGYLDAQHAELEEALQTLEQAIRRIDRETRQRFKETFEQVNQGLQTLFPKVFGGGTAWLQLVGDDLLETGVAIMARPPGKKNATIHLLSGGEKALTALALVFSIFELNPAPFCMLDEVDAPLDDANVGRYARLVKEMSARIQFIYITHNKQAMESAEQLMGVTMQEPGVSRLVSVDLEEASQLVDA